MLLLRQVFTFGLSHLGFHTRLFTLRCFLMGRWLKWGYPLHREGRFEGNLWLERDRMYFGTTMYNQCNAHHIQHAPQNQGLGLVCLQSTVYSLQDGYRMFQMPQEPTSAPHLT